MRNAMASYADFNEGKKLGLIDRHRPLFHNVEPEVSKSKGFFYAILQ